MGMSKPGAVAAGLLMAIGLGACATGYHDASNPIAGWTGGYWDRKGPGQLFKVGFSGNGYIKKEKVGVYVLYHAAEVVQREGKAYFHMYDSLNGAILDRRIAERTVSTIGGKPDAYVYVLPRDAAGPDVLAVSAILQRYQADVAPPENGS